MAYIWYELNHWYRSNILSFKSEMFVDFAYYVSFLDILVQMKLWKSLKLIFLENSFQKDKSVGL